MRLFNYKRNPVWAENLQMVMQIGLTMAGCIAFCFFIGLWLDRFFDTKGLFMVVFTLLGIAGGGNVVYRQIMDVMDPKRSQNSSPADTDNGTD